MATLYHHFLCLQTIISLPVSSLLIITATLGVGTAAALFADKKLRLREAKLLLVTVARNCHSDMPPTNVSILYCMTPSAELPGERILQ